MELISYILEPSSGALTITESTVAEHKPLVGKKINIDLLSIEERNSPALAHFSEELFWQQYSADVTRQGFPLIAHCEDCGCPIEVRSLTQAIL